MAAFMARVGRPGQEVKASLRLTTTPLTAPAPGVYGPPCTSRKRRVEAPRASSNVHAASGGSLPLSQLPGDPSLMLITNVDMGTRKLEFMKAASKAIAESLGTPETFVAVSVQDKQAVIWGGSDDPCALATLNSIGAINQANNKAFSSVLCGLLGEFDIPPNRYYINFFDVARENCGYNGATFAG